MGKGRDLCCLLSKFVFDGCNMLFRACGNPIHARLWAGVCERL